jgi:hypothetical protein
MPTGAHPEISAGRNRDRGESLGVVRRETGKEERVQVPYSKGLANHAGPESCVAYREVRREALTGVRVGRPLSREIKILQGTDSFSPAEGNTDGRVTASAWTALRGQRPWHARMLLVRKPGDLLVDHSTYGMARIGKARSRSR